MSIRGLSGTYEIEVLLGSQEVCLIDVDLPDSKNELRKLKIDTPSGEETFRGLLAGSFSLPGSDDDTRQVQIYDLMEGISSVRDAVEAGEEYEEMKKRFLDQSQDNLAQYALQNFLFFIEPLSRDKVVSMLAQFSKFLLNKKESLPKASSQTRTAKEAPRWDRVVKQNVLITDEPTQDIEVNPLEEDSVETDALDTEWPETGGDAEHMGEALDDDVEEESGDISDIP